MNQKSVLEEEAAMVTIELMREAQAVAEFDDISVNKGPFNSSGTGSVDVARMRFNQSHNESTRSVSPHSSVELDQAHLQKIKIVPHGVSGNVSTGIQMESSIPAKPPKGNKKSLFPCLVKSPMSPEETRAPSVSTTATFNTSTTSFGTSFSTSFGNSPEVSREGQRQMPVRHLNDKKWPPDMQLRAGTAEPRLTGAASEPNLLAQQGRATGNRKSPSAATQAAGDDLRVAQVGRLRDMPLPMRHVSAKGRPTDRPYVPEERWGRPPGMSSRFNFVGRPDRTY